MGEKETPEKEHEGKSELVVRLEKESVEMLKRPHRWPQLVLALKKLHHQFRDEDFAYAIPHPRNSRLQVRQGNIFEPSLNDPILMTDVTPEQVVAAGWIVD